MSQIPTPEPRLSTPAKGRAPRPLTTAERSKAAAIADFLVPRTKDHQGATDEEEFNDQLDRALDARSDAFEAVAGVLASLSDEASLDQVGERMRNLSDDDFETFHAVVSVVVGAWLMCSSVRERIGYPGQRAVTFAVDLGTEEITDGILDPVIERGAFYRPTPV